MKNKEGIDFKIGEVVDYHSIIGGLVTSKEHKITGFGWIGDVEDIIVYMSGHRACVSIDAITKVESGLYPRVDYTSAGDQ